MNYNEFRLLAKNPPHPNVATIFVVEEILVANLPQGKSRHYPCFEVTKRHAWFHTINEAEDCIRNMVVEDNQRYSSVYCYYMKEICPKLFSTDSPLDAVSCRLYDFNGILIDQSYYSVGLPETEDESQMRYYSIFRGRDKSMQRFKDGDIVEWYHPEGFVTLGILIDNWAPTLDDCWRSWQNEEKSLQDELWRTPSYKEIAEQYFWDYGDDAFTVLDGDIAKNRLRLQTLSIGHCLCLFKPRYKVPESTVRRLQKLRDKYSLSQTRHTMK